MRRFVILTALVLSCIGMMAQEKTVVKGEFDREDAPRKVTFFYRSGESVSAPVENGHFSVELPTDITKSYDVSMGRHVEVTIVPEGGTLTIRRPCPGRNNHCPRRIVGDRADDQEICRIIGWNQMNFCI